MSSLLLTRRGSFLVATMVPTISASSIQLFRFSICRASIVARRSEKFALGLRSGRLADRERVLEIGVRARNHMDRDQLADPARRRGACVGRRLDRRDVAA